MRVYQYSETTGEYLGEVFLQPSPFKKGEFLKKPYTTELEPVLEQGKITKFDGEKWVLENLPEPEPEPELSDEEKFLIDKPLKISSRKAYLQNTDYKIIKQVEGVEDCPQNILDKRNLARSEINEIEVCTTLEQLNNYSTEF